MAASLNPPYDDLTFLSPLSGARAGRLVRFLATDLNGVVLDVGCGWGELLARTVAVAPAARGVGIDTDQGSIEHGRRLLADRGLDERVTLICGDAKTEVPGGPDAVVCIGASQIWGPPVEDRQPLDYSAALAALRALVRRGARVVYGEAIWTAPPTEQALAPLSGRPDELVFLPDLVELAVDRGFMPAAVHEAGLDEWDEFESGYSARYAAWLAENGPDHPDAADIAARAARQRTGYFAGYRGVMGMAYLELLAV